MAGGQVPGSRFKVQGWRKAAQYSVLGSLCLILATVVRADEPQRFIPIADARPIEDAAAADSPLRWKAKNVGVALNGDAIPAVPIRAAQPAASTSATRANWNITRIDPSVRPAQATSDPFKDPFGDRKAIQAGAAEPMLLLQPTQAESAVEELPPPRATTALPPPPRASAPPMPLISRTQEPAPMAPAGEAPATPGPALAPAPTGAPCDKIFNERNCCDTLSNCQQFRERLLSDTIRNISLDISPRFSPDVTPEEEATARGDALRQAEIITWHNRRGQVVATGRMATFVNNIVTVTDEAGREVAQLSLQELGESELCYVTAYWRLPTECGLGGIRSAQRNWIPSTFAWTASGLCHKPLYFEEVQLERYGHTAGPLRQPFISGAHFFLNIAALPYNMAINPPHECQYALGYYRPGNCAPYMIPPIPLSLRGAAAQTTAVLGGVYLIP